MKEGRDAEADRWVWGRHGRCSGFDIGAGVKGWVWMWVWVLELLRVLGLVVATADDHIVVAAPLALLHF